VLVREKLRTPIWTISVVGMKDPVTQTVRRIIKTNTHAIGNTRVSSSTVSGMNIDDAFVFRSS
jgi:hypothetical protein